MHSSYGIWSIRYHQFFVLILVVNITFTITILITVVYYSHQHYLMWMRGNVKKKVNKRKKQTRRAIEWCVKWHTNGCEQIISFDCALPSEFDIAYNQNRHLWWHRKYSIPFFPQSFYFNFSAFTTAVAVADSFSFFLYRILFLSIFTNSLTYWMKSIDIRHILNFVCTSLYVYTYTLSV